MKHIDFAYVYVPTVFSEENEFVKSLVNDDITHIELSLFVTVKISLLFWKDRDDIFELSGEEMSM